MTSIIDNDILVPDLEGQPDHIEELAPWVVPEHDSAVFAPLTTGFQELAAVTFKASSGTHPDVRFTREIHQGMVGADVNGHKRALSRARPDLYPWPTDGNGFTDLAGEFFMDAVVKYKKSHGLGTARVLGGVAHESLERQHRKGHSDEWAFDALAIQKCQAYWDETHISPETRIRSAIVSAAFFWYGMRFNISYSQYRPFQLGKPPWVPTRWDCSAFATNCHYAGGAPDPNDRGYDHLGYTGTLMDHGTRVASVTSLKPGDLIFYGSSAGSASFPAGSPTHVAVYVGYRDGAHMVVSLGSYPMRYAPYNYRHDLNHFRTYKVA